VGNSFASLLISLRDPAYLEAFVLERNGVRTLANMSAHIVHEATARALQSRQTALAENNGDGTTNDEDMEAPPVAELSVSCPACD